MNEMNNLSINKNRMALRLAVKAGEVLLKNGAEIFRVQETIIRILEAFHVSEHSVYVISNGIFVNIGDDNVSIRYVPLGGIHLGRIAAVNDLSRKITSQSLSGDAPDFDALCSEVEQCGAIPFPAPWLRVLSCGMGSGCFCYIFGGSFFDCIAAFFAGLVLQLFLNHFGSKNSSRFIPTIAGACIVTIIAIIAANLFSLLTLDNIIIGSIIPLVPGVSFTTSIRDFFNGDYISGNIHLMDAMLTGASIAVGVVTSLQLYSALLGGVLS